MSFSGGLRHRVDIQQRTETQDTTTGESVTTWTTLWPKVPAKIEPLSVKEFLQSKTDQASVSARVTIRYRSGMDASMRIVHNSKIYNPAGFLADRKSGLEYLTMACSEGVNEG